MSFSLRSEDDILPFMRQHNLFTIKHIFKHDVAVIMYKYRQVTSDVPIPKFCPISIPRPIPKKFTDTDSYLM